MRCCCGRGQPPPSSCCPQSWQHPFSQPLEQRPLSTATVCWAPSRVRRDLFPCHILSRSLSSAPALDGELLVMEPAGVHGAATRRDGWTLELQDLLLSQVSVETRATLTLKVAAMLHHLTEPLAFPLLPDSQSRGTWRTLEALSAPGRALPPCGWAAVMGT